VLQKKTEAVFIVSMPTNNVPDSELTLYGLRREMDFSIDGKNAFSVLGLGPKILEAADTLPWILEVQRMPVLLCE